MSLLLSTLVYVLTDHVLVAILLVAALYFTFKTSGVQFTMFGEMCRLLVKSGKKDNDRRSLETDGHHTISAFQAFMVSIASRVGTGNLAGVATAISLGGPGAVFWMWVIALFGAASAFIESTLAQLFKERGNKSFVGGPAYYILKGTGKRWWAVTFAILITITFGLAFNSVQSNTIADAFSAAFDLPVWITGCVLTVLTLAIIWGGIQSIARFSEWIVPVMAVAYIVLALVIIIANFQDIPKILSLIVQNAFGVHEAVAGTFGMAISMGIKRGLFSNEAGEGSAPNVAATASVSHPVKQGLIQALGVFTDTLVICSCTAFIILCSGLYNGEASADGIVLTQRAIESQIGNRGLGEIFVSIAIFFFAFTSIVANYYYGETNLRFIRDDRRLINLYRLFVGAMVYAGAMAPLTFVWSFADVTMALMTICNVLALFVLGKFALICLDDYRYQARHGKDPVFYSDVIPELGDKISCWDATRDSYSED